MVKKKIVLRRYDAKTEKVGKIIVAQEDIFDAIDEWHRETNHLGCAATNNYVQ